MQVQPPPALFSIGEGSLYVCTNRGAFLCVDPASGRRRWAVKYPVPPPAQGVQRGMPRDIDCFWQPNPVVVRDGKVLIAPIDSEDLTVYDAATGQVRWQWSPRGAREQGANRMEHLFGPVNDRVYLVGARRWMSLEWEGGKRLESQDLPYPCAGRPAITPDALYWAGSGRSGEKAGGGIYRMNLAAPHASSVVVDWASLPSAALTGGKPPAGANLLVTAKALVGAAEDKLFIFEIVRKPEDHYQQLLKKDRTQTQVYVDLARFHLGQGEASKALALMKQGSGAGASRETLRANTAAWSPPVHG